MLRPIVRRMIEAPPQRTTLPILVGPLRGARWMVRSSNASCWLGTYERATQAALVEELRAGDCFLDVGAHVGFFTLLGARLVGCSEHTLAIEPLLRNAEVLNNHLRVNAAANVRLFRCAVSNERGRASVGTTGPLSCARLGVAGEDVEVRTLDDVLSEVAIGPVRLVKIDIEGEEARALAGAVHLLAQSPPPSLIIATHGWRAHAATVDRLASCGIDGIEATMEERSGNGTVRFQSRGWE